MPQYNHSLPDDDDDSSSGAVSHSFIHRYLFASPTGKIGTNSIAPNSPQNDVIRGSPSSSETTSSQQKLFRLVSYMQRRIQQDSSLRKNRNSTLGTQNTSGMHDDSHRNDDASLLEKSQKTLQWMLQKFNEKQCQRLTKDLHSSSIKGKSNQDASQLPQLSQPTRLLLQALSENILNVPFHEILGKLEYVARQQSSTNDSHTANPAASTALSASTRKNRLQKSIKRLKEDLSIIQKQYRLLQNYVKNRENRMRVLEGNISSPFRSGASGMMASSYSGASRGGGGQSSLASSQQHTEQQLSFSSIPTSDLNIKLDLNEFQLAVLKQDLERFAIQYERMRTKLVQMQNQLMKYQQTANAQKQTGLASSLSTKTNRHSSPTHYTDWHSALNFSSMDEADRLKFLTVVERLMWPRNNMIRNMFERNIGLLRFTDMLPNSHFWQLWYEKRKVHEYANRLRQQFRATHIPQPASILDDSFLFHRLQHVEPDYRQLQVWPTEDALFRDVSYIHQIEKHRDHQLFQSMHMMHEQDIPVYNHYMYDIRDTAVGPHGASFPTDVQLLTKDDTIHWRDAFYSYIYKHPNFHTANKESLEAATHHDDLLLWKEIFQSFVKLAQFLEEQLQQQTDDEYSNHNQQADATKNYLRDQLFYQYASNLCRVSKDAERSMWIMSQLLRRSVPGGVQDMDPNELRQNNRKHQPSPSSQKKGTTHGKEQSTSNTPDRGKKRTKNKYSLYPPHTTLARQLTRVVVKKTMNSVWNMIQEFKNNPISFSEKIQKVKREHLNEPSSLSASSLDQQKQELIKGPSLQRRLLLFVNSICTRFHYSSELLIHYLKILEVLFTYRMLLEESDFWQSIKAEMIHKNTEYGMEAARIRSPQFIYENDHFNFSPLHFSKRKRLTYKEKLKIIFCDVLSVVEDSSTQKLILSHTSKQKTAVQKQDIPSLILDSVKNRLKQQSKQHAKQYRLVSYDQIPTVSRIITEESAQDLRARIRAFYEASRGQIIQHVERHHVEEFSREEIGFIFRYKYPYLLDYRPPSHSVLVDYRHSKPFFALSALAQIYRERKQQMAQYSNINADKLEEKLDFALTSELQSLDVKEAQLRQIISPHLG